MGVGKGLGHLNDDLEGVGFLVDGARGQVVVDSLAVDILHHEVVVAARFAYVDGLHDVQHGFRLCEVEPAIQKGPRGEFPGFCQAGSLPQAKAKYAAQGYDATVPVDLHDVLADRLADGADLLLDPGVILGQLLDPLVPVEVSPAVPHVCQVGAPVVEEQRGQGCPHSLVLGVLPSLHLYTLSRIDDQ